MPPRCRGCSLRLTPAIFVLTIVLSLASVPYAIGQTLTTLTSRFTTTGVYTTNVYSTNTVGSTTITVESLNTFISTADTISAGAARFCTFDYWNITIDPGTTAVTGTIGPPSSPIDFFIMNQAQYDYFDHSSCDTSSYPAEVAVYSVTTTYSLNWQNPPTGWYYFIFFTESVHNPTVVTPFVLVAMNNKVQTSTILNTVTNQVTGVASQTLTSVQVTEASTGVLPGFSPDLIAGIIVVVLIVVVTMYLAKSRTRQEGKPITSAAQPTGDKLFCLNCGKPLPVGSKFCNKCGTEQE